MTHTIDGQDVRFVSDADAPAELQKFAERYWSIERVDDDGLVLWTVRSSELDARPLGDHRPHVIAALGGWLEVDEIECRSCGVAPYRPTSRNSLTASYGDAGCARCSSSLAAAIAEATDPQRRERMRARGARVAEVEAERREEHASKDERRRVLRTELRLPDEDLPRFDLEQAMFVLAISHAAREGGIGPVDGGVLIDPRRPASQQFDLLLRLRESGIVRIDPESDIDAFIWDGNETSRHYPNRVQYVFAGAGSPSERLATARADAELAIDIHGARGDEAVRDMVRDCIIGEVIRYLDWRLAKQHMEPADESHRAQIADALRTRLESLSIGRLYSAVNTAAKSAASARVSYGQRRRASTTTAVNRLIAAADEAVNQGYHTDPYGEVQELPLSPLTSVLFRMLLGLEPMTATFGDAMAAFDALPGWCQLPTSAMGLVMKVRESGETLNPEAIRAALETISDGEVDWQCGGTCRSHEQAAWVARLALRVDDAIVASGGDGHSRALAVLHAAAIGDADADSMTGGAVVEDVLARVAAV